MHTKIITSRSVHRKKNGKFIISIAENLPNKKLINEYWLACNKGLTEVAMMTFLQWGSPSSTREFKKEIRKKPLIVFILIVIIVMTKHDTQGVTANYHIYLDIPPIFYAFFIQFRVAGRHESIPVTVVRKAGYTLNRSPVHHRA